MLKSVLVAAAAACIGTLAACGPSAEEQAADTPAPVTETASADGAKGPDGDDGVLENAGEVVDGVGDHVEDSVNDATDDNPNTNP